MSTRTPGPVGAENDRNVPDCGTVVPSGVVVSMFTRAWIATPAVSTGVPVTASPSEVMPAGSPSSPKRRSAAMANPISTRSQPVTSSVMVCST
ncbi:Uncharacterised protein [Mycobacteroides abscessus subsp. abscessus]|nr:Uncharacterised protein [Mycobacteroides abscessus subsp. abscessus]